MTRIGRVGTHARSEPTRELVIFAKAPRAGDVKTRLGRDIGMEAAAKIYRQMGKAVVDRLRRASFRVIVSYAPHHASPEVEQWLGTDGLDFWPQVGADLGERMRRAFERAFLSADQVCVVGTDVPGLDLDLVGEAFELLGRHDVVFGPAADGGYYLLGLSGPAPELFEEIVWSTPDVLRDSEARAHAHGRSTARLRELFDLDTATDLRHHPGLRTGSESADV